MSLNIKHTREELLYLSKLAEQCERYDGKLSLTISLLLSSETNSFVSLEMVEYTQQFA